MVDVTVEDVVDMNSSLVEQTKVATGVEVDLLLVGRTPHMEETEETVRSDAETVGLDVTVVTAMGHVETTEADMGTMALTAASLVQDPGGQVDARLAATKTGIEEIEETEGTEGLLDQNLLLPLEMHLVQRNPSPQFVPLTNSLGVLTTEVLDTQAIRRTTFPSEVLLTEVVKVLVQNSLQIVSGRGTQAMDDQT